MPMSKFVWSGLVLLLGYVVVVPRHAVEAFLRPPLPYQHNPRTSSGLSAHSASITHYRRTYNNFRLGKAEGAKGETDQFHVEADIPAVDEELLESETFTSLAKSMTKVMDAISAYRISYSRFRQGYHQGAKGEISAVTHLMSAKHARFMPVAQRSNLMRTALEALAKGDQQAPLTRLHVHFGCGRLGMGLLSPAMNKAERPVILVDGPFGDYEKLAKEGHKTVNFYVNDEPTLTNVTLVTKMEDLPKDLYAPGLKVFVCSVDKDLQRKVVDACDTLSTSLGPVMHKVIMPHFDVDKPVGERTHIYGCENDHGMVEELGEKLEGKAVVVTCMVDRICTGREVIGNDIKINAEPHVGEVVILQPPQMAPLPAFVGDNVKVPMTYGEANYFCRRKITMVNGMHTTLAFMTLCREETGGHPGDHKLITNAVAPPDMQAAIWHWAVARLLLVLWEHDHEIIRHAHGLTTDDEVCETLIAYARSSLNRFDTVDDTTGRVLAGGVANRWNTRLKVALNYLDSQPRPGQMETRLLKMAGVKYSQVVGSVKTLVEDSERFVGKAPASQP
ncbi:unnamed protein product [Ascophyllum nodosum]